MLNNYNWSGNMTQQETQLLFRDLCARMPYRVKINIRNDYTLTMDDIEFNAYHLTTASYDFEYRGLRPYLRSMSNMTEKERKYLQHHINECFVDYCNEHYLDYRGLIPKGLALEAPKDMYKTE